MIHAETHAETHAERLLWLAKLESERAGYAFHQEGTRLPHFPSLRQPCPEGCPIPGGQVISPCVAGGFSRSLVCGTCQGRGFVPVDSLEATMEAISGPIAFVHTERDEWACNLESGIPDGGWTEWCGIPNEAAVLALYEHEMARAKPKEVS